MYTFLFQNIYIFILYYLIDIVNAGRTPVYELKPPFDQDPTPKALIYCAALSSVASGERNHQKPFPILFSFVEIKHPLLLA